MNNQNKAMAALAVIIMLACIVTVVNDVSDAAVSEVNLTSDSNGDLDQVISDSKYDGKEVIFTLSAGEYTFDNTDSSNYFHGSSLTIRAADNAKVTVKVSHSENTGAALGVQQSSEKTKLIVEGINFVSNEGMERIDVWNFYDISFTECMFTDVILFRQSGTLPDETQNGSFALSECEFKTDVSDNNYAVTVIASSIILMDNTFEGYGRGPNLQVREGGGDIIIAGNTVTNLTYTKPIAFQICGDVGNRTVMFSNNTVKNGFGLSVYHNLDVSDGEIVVFGNTFTGCTADIFYAHDKGNDQRFDSSITLFGNTYSNGSSEPVFYKEDSTGNIAVTPDDMEIIDANVDDATFDWYTPGNVMVLDTAEELEQFAMLVNSGITFMNETVELGADIALTDEWEPIGTGIVVYGSYSGPSAQTGYIGNPFKGIFDGKEHTIEGLRIAGSSSNDVLGLFGIVDGGEIRNVILSEMSINVVEAADIGGIVGHLTNGTVSGCDVSGSITVETSDGKYYHGVGGIVGFMMLNGMITNCDNSATIGATTPIDTSDPTVENLGGIVGSAYYSEAGSRMEVSYCSNSGSVTGTKYVAGIAGMSSAFITECTNSGAVTIVEDNQPADNNSVGGIVGEQRDYGAISGCTNSGAVKNNGNDYGTGGIVGWVRYWADSNGPSDSNGLECNVKATISVTDCVNESSGKVTSVNSHVGGIIGAVYHSVEVEGCINYADIGGSDFVGGILGGMQTVHSYHPDDGCRLLLVDCENHGTVTSIGSTHGSIIGHHSSTDSSSSVNCNIDHGSYWTVYDVTDEKNKAMSTGLEEIASTAVIIIDDEEYGYTGVSDAIEKAASGSTVRLVSDVTESITIPAGKEIVLDLNGYTLTNTEGLHTIINYGTLTIIDSSEDHSGAIDNISNARAAVMNEPGANAYLEGGSYLRSEETGSDPDTSGKNTHYNIVNHGTMTISDGVTVSQDGGFSSLVENGWYNGNENTNKTPSVMTIDGGTFTGGLNTIKNDDCGELTINGGTFSNVVQSAVLNWNEATINGGTFSVEGNDFGVILNGFLNNDMDKGTLNINGGTFDGAITVQKMGGSINMGAIKIAGGVFKATSQVFDTQNEANADIEVSGGLFSQSIDETYLTSGFDEMVQNDDGMYAPSVSEEEAIAKIGNAGYSTLQQAFDAARGIVSDHPITIVLQGNFTGGGAVLPSGSNIILDFNGYTYTNTGEVGSTGTESNGFQLLRDSIVVFTNGTLTASGSECKLLIQNYADLTLEGMTLNVSSYVQYTVSNNFGSMTVTDGTVINSSETGYAFDVYYWPNNGYADGVVVNIEDGTINGDVLYGTDETDAAADFRGKAVLNITGGTINGTISTYGKATGETEESKPDINISGGIFTSDVSDYLVDGFVLVENGDGTFGAEEYTPVLISEGVYIYLGGGDYQIELVGDYTGTVTYVSGDTTVATVTDEGIVKAVAAGETVVTVTVAEGRSSTLTVIVDENPLTGETGIVVDPFDQTDVNLITSNPGDSLLPEVYEIGWILDISAADGAVGPHSFTVGFDLFSDSINAGNYRDYDFFVLHFAANAVELADISVSDAGVTVTVDGFSPFMFAYAEKSTGSGGDDEPVNPPITDDDDYVPIPPVVVDDSSDDDTVKIVACAAAAVVAAIMAAFLILGHRRE